MVEPPGIAPGSSPLITCAFISIDRANPDAPNIGVRGLEMKSALERGSTGDFAKARNPVLRTAGRIWGPAIAERGGFQFAKRGWQVVLRQSPRLFRQWA